MDPLVILVCVSSAALCCLILIWKLCTRRLHKRKESDNRTFVFTSLLHPHIICKPVPCQHPYYRVISEYNSRTYNRMPDIQEVIEESSKETEEPDITTVCHPKNFDHTEWYRKFSITSLPRRYSWGTESNKKISSCESTGSSRRSSDSSNTSVPLSPVYKTKPTLVTQNATNFRL